MFDNPNVMIFSDGPIRFDRPLQIKLIGSVMLPYDIVLTGYLQHRTGTHWRRTIDRVYFPDSIADISQDSYVGVAAEERASRRNPTFTMIDMRVEKSFTFGDFGKLSLYIDAFNLGGRSGYSIDGNPDPRLRFDRDPVEWDDSSTYRDVTSCYGVRSFRFGAKFSF
jgi:hypothetical protein